MNKEEALSITQEVFRSTLEDKDLELAFETSQDNLERWDSIENLNLLTAIEKRLGIKFAFEQMLAIRSVGDICEFVVLNVSNKD